MKFILGKKKEMQQIFSEDGTVISCTLVQAGPCYVTQIKETEKDKYQSIQIGYDEARKLSKAECGHLKNVKKNLRHLREIRDKHNEGNQSGIKIGDTFGVETFNEGDIVVVSGVSKGKGFQGVVKRHGFSGSLASHGHKDQLRMPGSIGSTGPAHVFKGLRMAGRMGGDNVTTKNLEVIKIDEENNLIYIKGAIPGAFNGLVEIKGEGEMRVRSPKPEVQNEIKNHEQAEDVKELVLSI